jgi:hypothetical protein
MAQFSLPEVEYNVVPLAANAHFLQYPRSPLPRTPTTGPTSVFLLP